LTPRAHKPSQELLPGTPQEPAGPDAGWGHEQQAWADGYRLVAGLDEVGRGALAGPVVVAAVVFAPGADLPGLRDSKALSAQRREELAGEIRDAARCWTVAAVDAQVVDRVNVLEATYVAMRQAVAQLPSTPDLLLLDAVRLPGTEIPQRRLVRGDRLCASIAAASILAKIERDRCMVEFDRIYTYYRFGENKGYGTPAHLAALERQGPCPIHRLSFRRVRGREDPQDRLPA
jgi:ribonuclease HII